MDAQPGLWHTWKKPYSVNATKAIGMVLMKHPAIGMKLQMKTKSDWRPIPGMARRYMPRHVSPVFTKAMRDCTHRTRYEAQHRLASPAPCAQELQHDASRQAAQQGWAEQVVSLDWVQLLLMALSQRTARVHE